MATAEESNDEDDKLNELGRKFSDLQSDRIQILERARADNKELERIAKLQQECIDEHLRSMQYEREKMQRTEQHVMQLESQLEQEKYENLKLSDGNIKLRQSLNQAEELSKMQKRQITELENMVTLPAGKTADVSVEAQSETKDSIEVVELQKRLSKTTEELNEMRQHLFYVQEQLTVAKEVTAATQQREVQETGNAEQLQLELTPQHQPTTSKGISYEQILDRSMFALFSTGPIYSYFL